MFGNGPYRQTNFQQNAPSNNAQHHTNPGQPPMGGAMGGAMGGTMGGAMGGTMGGAMGGTMGGAMGGTMGGAMGGTMGGPPQGYNQSSPDGSSVRYNNGPQYPGDPYGQGGYGPPANAPGPMNHPPINMYRTGHHPNQFSANNNSPHSHAQSLPPPSVSPIDPQLRSYHDQSPGGLFSNASNAINGSTENYQRHISRLEHEIEEIKTSMKTLTTNNVEMQEAIQAIQAGLNITSRTKGTKGMSNLHPECKQNIHAMFWGMMDIGPNDIDRDTKMAEGCDPNTEPFKTDPNEPEKQVWRPDWSKAVNTGRNALFIKEVVTRVYDNETKKRKIGNGELTDVSYDQTVMKAIAQTYFGSTASMWKKKSTPEGTAKLAVDTERKKIRSRREAVTRARRQSVEAFQNKYNVKGVVGLLDTDFASSMYSLDEELVSDSTKARRKEQDCREGDWIIKSKKWRRKTYVRLLRELDQLTILRESLPSTVDAQGLPVKKKVKKNARKPTNRFHANVDKASQRPPSSSKSPPTLPTTGMVKTSWLTQQPSGNVLEMAANPAWWKMFKATNTDLPEKVVKYLNELSDDTASEAGSAADASVADASMSDAATVADASMTDAATVADASIAEGSGASMSGEV